MSKAIRLILSFWLFAAVSSASWAGDFEDGWEAYDNGEGVIQDYKEAVKWYRLAAEQGDAIAQSNLGVKYAKGEGVIQDNIYAHMWFNIVASTGNLKGSEYRDIIQGKMTQEDISLAQKLALECVAKGFKEC